MDAKIVDWREATGLVMSETQDAKGKASAADAKAAAAEQAASTSGIA